MVINEQGISGGFLDSLARQVSLLRAESIHSIMVGSGAIACSNYYGKDITWAQRELLAHYEQAFGQYGLGISEHLVVDQDLEIGRKTRLKIMIMWQEKWRI